MNPQIEMMITSYKTGVETTMDMISDKSKLKDLQDTYDELLKMAKENENDFMAFINKTQETDIFTRLTEEMRKANELVNKQQEDPSSRKELGKQQLVNMYKRLYEQAKTRPFPTETLKAYEELLYLADEYESSTAWQRACYEKGIIHRLSMMPAYDKAKLEYDKTEPNDIYMKKLAEKDMEIAKTARSGDEMSYKTIKNSYLLMYEDGKRQFIKSELLSFQLNFGSYQTLKHNARIAGLARPDILYFVKLMRDDLKRHYNLLVKYFDLDWKTIVATPYTMKEFLYRRGDLEDFVWYGSNPANLEWYEDILFNEILTDKPVWELLCRRPQKPFYRDPGWEHTKAYNLYEMTFEKTKQVAENDYFYWAEYDLETIKKSMDEYYKILKKESGKNRKKEKLKATKAKLNVFSEFIKDELTSKVRGEAIKAGF